MTASSKISVGPLELEFSTAKMLGAVGALFLVGSLIAIFLPHIRPLDFALFSVGGLSLFVSLYYYSKLYGNPSIYINYLYSLVLLGVIGVISIAYVIIKFTPFDSAGVAERLYRVRGEDTEVAALVVFVFLLLLLALFFYYRALTYMAVSSRVELFRYAGLSALAGGGLIFAGAFIGAFLLVRGGPTIAGAFLPIIGLLFMPLGYLALIASHILLLFAFLEIREPQPSPPPQPIEPAAPA